MEPTQEQKARKVVAGLRELADFVEANPEFAKAFPVTVHVPVTTRDEIVAFARKLGRSKKVADNNYVIFRRSFGPVEVEVFALKTEATCRRVELGEKTIPAEPETVIPAKPERVEKVYGWECPDSFFKEDADSE
jgi:hypothetical protein